MTAPASEEQSSRIDTSAIEVYRSNYAAIWITHLQVCIRLSSNSWVRSFFGCWRDNLSGNIFRAVAICIPMARRWQALSRLLTLRKDCWEKQLPPRWRIYPDFDLQAVLLKRVAQNIFESFSLRTTPWHRYHAWQGVVTKCPPAGISGASDWLGAEVVSCECFFQMLADTWLEKRLR